MPAAAATSLLDGMLAVQKEIGGIDFPKSATNPHFKSKYCPLDVVMELALPVLHKHKFVLVQQTTYIENEGALRTTLVHVPSGEKVEDVMLLMPRNSNPQDQGSAITYARRYALQCLLGIVPEDDVDGTQSGGGQRTSTPRESGTNDATTPEYSGGFDSGASPI